MSLSPERTSSTSIWEKLQKNIGLALDKMLVLQSIREVPKSFYTRLTEAERQVLSEILQHVSDFSQNENNPCVVLLVGSFANSLFDKHVAPHDIDIKVVPVVKQPFIDQLNERFKAMLRRKGITCETRGDFLGCYGGYHLFTAPVGDSKPFDIFFEKEPIDEYLSRELRLREGGKLSFILLDTRPMK